MTQPRTRASGAYLNLPLWQRFALALLVAAALLSAMVVFVNANNTNSNPSTNPAAAVQANREAEILVAQDQSPRTARLPGGLSPAQGLERVIHLRMAARVAFGALSGPLERTRCRPAGSSGATVHAFTCRVVSGSVVYPFLGVVDTSARLVTYCKRDPPPVPSDDVPVSPRCRA